MSPADPAEADAAHFETTYGKFKQLGTRVLLRTGPAMRSIVARPTAIVLGLFFFVKRSS